MTGFDWRVLALAREAALNLAHARAAMALTVIFAVAFGSASSAFAAFEAHRFTEALTALESRGSRVVAFGPETSKGDARISRASCERLAQQPGVRRAGLLVDEGARDLPELGARTTVFSASTTLFPGLAYADGLIGPDLIADGRGTRPVTFGTGDIRRLAPSARQPEGLPTNSAVVVSLAADTVNAPLCVVELARYQEVTRDVPVLASQLDVTGGAVAGVLRVRPTTNAIADWRARPGQLLTIGIGVTGGLLTLVLIGRRSHELAAYRLSGTRRRSLALLLTFEVGMVAGTFVFSAALGASMLAQAVVSLPELIAWSLGGGAAWSLVALIGVVKAVLTSPEAQARAR